jgi:ribonucleoside-diphosphate reductase alpha chain
VKSNKEGDFVVVNKYLVSDLKNLGLWGKEMLNKLKFNDGSVQNIREIPVAIKEKYKEVFEIDPKWLIDAAAQRAKWIDQSQSLNIFFRKTSGKELSELYFHAWKMGIKTTYYLRTLGASQVEKSTLETAEFGATHTRNFSESAREEVKNITADVVHGVPESIPAGKSPADAAFMARVLAGEEVGICESCES